MKIIFIIAVFSLCLSIVKAVNHELLNPNRLSKASLRGCKNKNSSNSMKSELNENELYKDMEYEELLIKIQGIAKLPQANKVLKLQTAQKLYKIPNPGKCKDQDCESHVLFITNFENKDPSKPQVLFSGAVHGDERPGPNAVTELAEILVRNYGKDPWVTHLVDTRLIIIVPTANSQGYCNHIRGEKIGEEEYDPNRDFPYVFDTCLNTATTRILYSLFAKHLVSLSITYHAGDHSITFPWGSPNHLLPEQGPEGQEFSTESPDKTAFDAQVKILQQISASGNKNFPEYTIGGISDIVYSVGGGMEDWAYAAGWENLVQNFSKNKTNTQPVTHCNPQTYGGFPAYNQYNMSHQRCGIILIETSLEKGPNRSTLGKRSDFCALNFNHNPFNGFVNRRNIEDCSKNDGYIAQNIRNSLAMIDMVEPYVYVSSMEKQGVKQIIKWKVGGAQVVDETFVLWAKASEIAASPIKIDTIFNLKGASKGATLNNNFLHQARNLEETLTQLKRVFPHKTKGKRGDGCLSFSRLKNSKVFIEELEKSEEEIYFIVVAKTDQHFANQSNPDPHVKPQTHFVNSRTNPKYYMNYKHLEYSIRSSYYVFSKAFMV